MTNLTQKIPYKTCFNNLRNNELCDLLQRGLNLLL